MNPRILCNVCSGTPIQVEMLLAQGFMTQLTEIVEQYKPSMNMEILNTIVHASANLCAAPGASYDIFVDSKLFKLLLQLYQSATWPASTDQCFSWLISNILYSGKDIPMEEQSHLTSILCLNFLKYQLGAYPEMEQEILWGISVYVNQHDNKEQRVNNLVTSKTLTKIVLYLKRATMENTAKEIIMPLLNILGNCSSCSNEIIDTIMDLDFAQVLYDYEALITFSKSKFLALAKNALWVISNIMASSYRCISMMALDDLFDWLSQSLRFSSPDIKGETCHVIKNFVTAANSDMVEEVLKKHLKVREVYQDPRRSCLQSRQPRRAWT